MLRSHRLLRLVHRLRCERFVYAERATAFRPSRELSVFYEPMNALAADGIADGPSLRERAAPVSQLLVGVLLHALSEPGSALRIYADGRSATPHVGVAAPELIGILTLDRLARAAEAAMRRRACVDHRRTPRWPEAYRERDRLIAEADAQGDLLTDQSSVDVLTVGLADDGSSPTADEDPPSLD